MKTFDTIRYGIALVLLVTGPASVALSTINDVNNWLGRSQWVQDSYLSGRYEELRIYDGALSDAEVAMLAERGPDHP